MNLQWDLYKTDTLGMRKVSSFQGRFTLVEFDELIIRTFESVYIIDVSTLQRCPQDGTPLCLVHVKLKTSFLVKRGRLLAVTQCRGNRTSCPPPTETPILV